jgi:RNA polymerase subunit RPABC4/transcription elongation factor Spt4
MSRFADGLRIIRPPAWITAIVFYLFMSNLAFFVLLPTDKEMKNWPVIAQIAFAYGVFLILPAMVLLVGYVYADAKRRSMRYVMWTWLATLVPDGIGIILYFILRDPLPKPCPRCATPVRSSFVFCPNCGAAMQPTCPQCGRAVDVGWSHCPHCGSNLPTQTPRAALPTPTGEVRGAP